MIPVPQNSVPLAQQWVSLCWHSVGELVLAFTWRELLEGVDGATDHIAVEDCRLVALDAAPVVRTAAEDAGPPCLPRAVGTLVATLVTSIAPEVVQSLFRELESPGWESSREDLFSRVWRSSHSVRPVRAID